MTFMSYKAFLPYIAFMPYMAFKKNVAPLCSRRNRNWSPGGWRRWDNLHLVMIRIMIMVMIRRFAIDRL